MCFLSSNSCSSWYLSLVRIQSSITIFIVRNLLHFHFDTFILIFSSFLRRWRCYQIKIQINMLWRNNSKINVFVLISTVVLTFLFVLPFLLAIFTQATYRISWSRIHSLFTVSLFPTIIDILIVVPLFYFYRILHRGRHILLSFLYWLLLLFSLNLLS